jgi:hypothetical protein
MADHATIRVAIRSTLTGKDRSDPAEEIYQEVQQIRQTVAQLRDDNLDFERVRDQHIIHLQQCTDDHHVLRQIFKRLRLKLELAAQAAPAAAEAPAMRLLPTLESVRVGAAVASHHAGFPAGASR